MMQAIAASRDREEGLAALRHARECRVRIGGERLPADPLAAAPDAWLRSKKLAQGVPAHFAGDEVAADALVGIIDTTAEAFLLEGLSWSANSKDDPQSVPPARLLRVSAGSGKSRRVIDAIADSAGLLRGRTVYYLAPSHALAAELTEYARGTLADRLPVFHIKGRTYHDPQRPEHDPTPCRKAAIVAEAMRTGVRDVYASFCSVEDPASGKWRDCPFKPTCRQDGYLSQLVQPRPGLYFLTHRVLALSPPRQLPEPDLLVVDEDTLDVFASYGTTAVDRILAASQDRPLATLVVDALLHGANAKAALLAAGVAGGRCRDEAAHHARLASSARPVIFPDEPECLQRRKLERMRADDHGRLAAFWRLLAEELDQPWPGLQRLLLERDASTGDGLRAVVRRYARRPLSAAVARTPTLVLDATAETELYRLIWPQLQVSEARARRRARFIGVYDTTNSRHRCLAGPTAPRNRERLGLIVDRLSRRHRQLALFSYRALLETLGELPANVVSGHFGALRGLDRMRDCDAAIVIGRNELAIDDAEGVARALAGDRQELAFITPDENGRKFYPRRLRGFRLADPGFEMGIPVSVHPDPLVQRVVERAREREIEQAIDRLRLIHRREPATVYLLCSLPVDVAYDALLPEDAFLPSRLELALTSLHLTDGLLDLNRARLPLQRGDLWKTTAAAKQDPALRQGCRPDEPQAGIGLPALMRDLIRANRLILGAYRVEGRGGCQASLVALDPLFVAEPRKAVERYVRSAYDANLKSFEILLQPADLDEELDAEATAERLAIRTETFVELPLEQLALLAAVLGPEPTIGLMVRPNPADTS